MKNAQSIKECDLTVEKLREYFDYFPDTGFVIWKKKTNRNTVIGSRAGCIKSDGYRYVRFDNFEYLEHRLIWFGMIGKWPEHNIDHKDLIKSNNIWTNLREATVSQNGMNTHIRKDNTSGYKGIRQRGNKFHVRIQVNNQEITLCGFNTFEEALAARLDKEKELHGEYAKAMK